MTAYEAVKIHADFHGRCPDGDLITPGELIVPSPEGWRHERCSAEPEPRATCPRCRLELPANGRCGDCD